ncbi:MAG: hypothetical protein R2774_14095 [Saprospiraceae bacterium]
MFRSILSLAFFLCTIIVLSGQQEVEFLENELYRFESKFSDSGDNSLALTNAQKQAIYALAKEKYTKLKSIENMKGDKYDMHLEVVRINNEFETQFEKALSPSQRLFIISKEQKKIKLSTNH